MTRYSPRRMPVPFHPRTAGPALERPSLRLLVPFVAALVSVAACAEEQAPCPRGTARASSGACLRGCRPSECLEERCEDGLTFVRTDEGEFCVALDAPSDAGPAPMDAVQPDLPDLSDLGESDAGTSDGPGPDASACPPDWEGSLSLAPLPDTEVDGALDPLVTADDGATVDVQLVDLSDGSLLETQPSPARFAPPGPGQYQVVAVASRPGCEPLTVRSRAIGVCDGFWEVREGVLPDTARVSDVVLLGSQLLALSSVGPDHLFLANLEEAGVPGPFETVEADFSAPETAVDTDGTRLVPVAFGLPGAEATRVFVVGGSGASASWVRYFDLAGPGSLSVPPVVFANERSLPEGVFGPLAGFGDNRLYVVGGRDSTGAFTISYESTTGRLQPGFTSLAEPEGFRTARGVVRSRFIVAADGHDDNAVGRVLRGTISAEAEVSWSFGTSPSSGGSSSFSTSLDSAVVSDHEDRWLVIANARVWRAPLTHDGDVGSWGALPTPPASLSDVRAAYPPGRLLLLARSGFQHSLWSLSLVGPDDTPVCP